MRLFKKMKIGDFFKEVLGWTLRLLLIVITLTCVAILLAFSLQTAATYGILSWQTIGMGVFDLFVFAVSLTLLCNTND